MLKKILKLLPGPVKVTIKSARAFILYIYYRSGNNRWCPVCEKSTQKFLPFGISPREDARCPFCGALERHRFVWLYFIKMTNLFDKTPKLMLHIAPERGMEARLRSKLKQGYLTADLFDPHADMKMDITNIQYPDEHFNIIYCSHVLEFVQNDK